MSRGVREHHSARAAVSVRVVVKGLLAACPSTSTTRRRLQTTFA